MPCNSDYLNPNSLEKESIKVIKFLKSEFDVDVGNFDNVYGRVQTLNEDVALLCELCQNSDVSKFSLELQLWWRNHQEKDRIRLNKEIAKLENAKKREIALSKLSDYEKKLLGLI